MWNREVFQCLNDGSTNKPKGILLLEYYASYQSAFFDDYAWYANIAVVRDTGERQISKICYTPDYAYIVLELYFIVATSAHVPVSIAFGFELETHGGVNWNTKKTGNGTKVYGNLPLMNPYVAVCYWRRVA